MARGRIITALLVAGALASGCVERESARPRPGDMKKIKANILKKAPAMKFKVNADLEGRAVYLGADVDVDTVEPGKAFTITHYWKVNKPLTGWRLFVHLNDPDQKHFVNADHKPVEGLYPVSSWKKGEIVRDRHKVTLPGSWNADKVTIYTGLWRGQERMKPKGPQDGHNRIIVATLPVAVKAAAEKPTLRRLVAVKVSKPITLDGKLDEPAWKAARSSGAFVDTMTGDPGKVTTEVRVLYDDTHLYIAFENQDDDVWSSLTKRDDKLWTQEAVEVFIDADGDGKDYVELQVNPRGAIFDSYLPAYRENQNDWNGKLKAAVKVDGTVTKRDDEDRGWTVEMAIPWSDVKGRGKGALRLPPRPGDRFRVNFFRLDKPAKGGQVAVAWSPPLVGDFHKLDRFGELVFGDAKGEVPERPAPAAPAGGATAAEPPAKGQGPALMVEQPNPLNRAIRVPLQQAVPGGKKK